LSLPEPEEVFLADDEEAAANAVPFVFGEEVRLVEVPAPPALAVDPLLFPSECESRKLFVVFPPPSDFFPPDVELEVDAIFDALDAPEDDETFPEEASRPDRPELEKP
jgi:hypothetical protein